MPDPVLFLSAGAASAVVSAALMLLLGRPWSAPRSVRTEIGSVLGVGLGFYVGCWVLGITVGWPLPSRDRAQDLDRLLLVVIPAVMLSELLAAAPGKFRFVASAVRLFIMVERFVLLLDSSIYITDVAGPGTREWTAGDALCVCRNGCAGRGVGSWAGYRCVLKAARCLWFWWRHAGARFASCCRDIDARGGQGHPARRGCCRG